MADRIIKSDSGNDTVIQNNSGSRKIEVTNSGDVEVTGDLKATTVKATNLKANDGTAGLVVADSTGEVTGSGGLKATNIKTTNLKANDGTAGLVIADSTGRISVSESNPVITLGSNTTFGSGVSLSNATFPAGMLLKRTLIKQDKPSSGIRTSTTGFTTTDIAGSFVTKKASSASVLYVFLVTQMTYLKADYAGETGLQMTTSSDTTHTDADDFLGSLAHKNYNLQNSGGTNYMPQNYGWYYEAGVLTPSNKTSYSAGETLYLRIFTKTNNSSSDFDIVHADSFYFFYVDEVAK